MPTVTERVSVLETKVENIAEKIDDIKIDMEKVHDCLHKTGESLHATLDKMSEKAETAHDELAKKISELEKFKAKWMYLIMGGIAVLGFASGHAAALLKLVS